MDLVLNTRVRLPGKDNISAAAFHPVYPTVHIASGLDVREYDLHSRAQLAHFRANAQVLALRHCPSHNYLIAVLKNQALQIWDLDTQVTVSVFPSLKKNPKKVIAYLAPSHVKPLIFYTHVGSKNVYVVDIQNKTRTPLKLEKVTKPVTALVCHPTKALVAIGFDDGYIRVLDAKTGALRYVLDEHASEEKAKSIRRPAISSLLFHPWSDLLIVGYHHGRVGMWDVTYVTSGRFMGQRAVSDPEDRVVSMQFLQWYPLLLVLTARGRVQAIRLAPKLDGPATVPGNESAYFYVTGLMPEFDPSRLELSSRPADLSSGDGNPFPTRNLIVHPQLSLVAFQFSRDRCLTPALNVYKLVDTLNPPSTRALVCPYPVPMSFYTEAKADANGELVYQPDLFYISKHKLMSYSLANGEETHVTTLQHQHADQALRPVRLTYSALAKLFLVIFEGDTSAGVVLTPGGGSLMERTDKRKFYYALVQESDIASSIVLSTGRDATFYGSDGRRYATLSVDGATLTVHTVDGSAEALNCAIGAKAHRVFATPLGDGTVVAFADLENRRIALSANVNPNASRTDHTLSPTATLSLHSAETPLDVCWQSFPNPEDDLVAILTSDRLMITGPMLSLYTSIDLPAYDRACHISSCYWLDGVLLYTTPTHINYLTLDGRENSLCSIDAPDANIVVALNDRVMIATLTPDGTTEVRSHTVGLVEPLIAGVLALHEAERTAMEEEETANGEAASKEYVLPVNLQQQILSILTRYDCSRVSEALLDRLCKVGCANIAFELSLVGPQFTPFRRYEYAVRARRFEAALNVLQMLHKASPNHPHLDPGSHLHRCFEELAEICGRLAQFTIVNSCLQVLKEYWKLFDLYVVFGNKKGLNMLIQKLDGVPEHIEVVNACKVMLSTGSVQECTTEPAPPKKWPLAYASQSVAKPALSLEASAQMKVDAQGMQETEAHFISAANTGELSQWTGGSDSVWSAPVAAASLGGVSGAAMGATLGATAGTPPSVTGGHSRRSSQSSMSGISDQVARPSHTRTASGSSFNSDLNRTSTFSAGGLSPEKSTTEVMVDDEGFSIQPDSTSMRRGFAADSDSSSWSSDEEDKKPAITFKIKSKEEAAAEMASAAPIKPLTLTLGGPPSAASANRRRTWAPGATQQKELQAHIAALDAERERSSSNAPQSSDTSWAAFGAAPTAPPIAGEEGGEAAAATADSPQPASATDSPAASTPIEVKIAPPTTPAGADAIFDMPAPIARSPSTASAVSSTEGGVSDDDNASVTDTQQASPALPPPALPPRSGRRSPGSPGSGPATPSSTGEGVTPPPPLPTKPVSPSTSRQEPAATSPRAEGGAAQGSADPFPRFDSKFDSKWGSSETPVANPAFSASTLPLPSTTAVVTTPAAGAVGDEAVDQNAKASSEASELLKVAVGKLEKGIFAAALVDTTAALKLLNPAAHTPQIKFVTRYHLALQLLVEVKKVESTQPVDTARAGLLTKFLAEVNIGMKHRVVCMRMAIKRNVDAGNFEVARPILEFLIPQSPPEKAADLESKLAQCKENAGVNRGLPEYTCPACSTAQAPATSKCSSCRCQIRYSQTSFTLITGAEYVLCVTCDATFSPEDNHSQCPQCHHGPLHTMTAAKPDA